MLSLRIGLCLSTFATSAFLVGCGGADRPKLAEASGIITLDGEPVEGATVNFQPVEGGRIASDITDATGRYEVNAYPDAKGVPVGDHNVTVMKLGGEDLYKLAGAAPPEGDDPSGENSLMPDLSTPEGKEPKIEYLVPQKYMNFETSDLKATVPAGGTNDLNFELKSE